MKKYNIGIVVSEFNFDITSMMLERAKAHAAFLDVNVAKIISVPGVYDMPLAIKKLCEDPDIDGVATLGCVIEGETGHVPQDPREERLAPRQFGQDLQDLPPDPLILAITVPQKKQHGLLRSSEGSLHQLPLDPVSVRLVLGSEGT